MSSLYSETTQEPPVTVVLAPVSCQLTWTSNSSSTSSSEVTSGVPAALSSVGSSTLRSVTWPFRRGFGPGGKKSVSTVWNELD